MTGNAWENGTLGVIGGGNMAEALVRGIVAAGLIPPGRITVTEPLPERRRIFGELGCREADGGVIPPADALLLAVKPQVVRAVLGDMAASIRPGTLVVTLAAGIGTAVLEKALPPGTPVVRVMPNTPLLVGKGVSALAAGTAAGPDEMARAVELFSCAGAAYTVAEDMLDAVTALSGCGPAYLFRFAEALVEAGLGLGLDAALARDLAIGTLAGSAEMLDKCRDPALLRRRVTSPGGATKAALDVFERYDVDGMVRDALAAAHARSGELGRGE